jgi:hypothetical protein
LDLLIPDPDLKLVVLAIFGWITKLMTLPTIVIAGLHWKTAKSTIVTIIGVRFLQKKKMTQENI